MDIYGSEHAGSEATPRVKETGPRLYVYDTETFPNCFLVVFKEITDSRDAPFLIFTHADLGALRRFLAQEPLALVGYNNFTFDDVLLKAILEGNIATPQEIHAFAERLIHRAGDDDKALHRLIYYGREEWDRRTAPWTCIDLFQILGGRRVAGSLKTHEVRLGMRNVQDLPYKPGTLLSDEQIQALTAYCQHDVEATEALFFDMLEDIDVRFKVNQRFPYLHDSALRRTNASIAEEVIKRELTTRAGLSPQDIRKPATYPFDPVARVDPAVTFLTAHNQALLERLKALPPFEVSEWLEGLNKGFTFRVGPHAIALGRGGAHTIIGHKHVRSQSIIEYDVASFYPSLLRKFDTYPVGLTREWIAILNELTDARLTMKKAGDKATAGVYKLIINSVYGKLEDTHSISLDSALQLQVVLNGQLCLIMLMEQFYEAGFEVISGNTDGVYINARDRLEEAHRVAERWMTQTGFELDHKVSMLYVASSVNDYALYHPDRGWYHKKGRFSVGTRTRPAIITDAVLNYFSTSERVEAYIRRATNLLDFLYSSTVRGEDVIEIKHGDTPVQRTNRWYKSTTGRPIEKCVRQKNGDSKWLQVPNSDSSIVANTLASTALPDDLDYDHYTGAAQTLLDDILQSKPSKEIIQSKLIKQAKKAQERGLSVVPKGRRDHEKANVPGTYSPEVIEYWRKTPLEHADWRDHHGFGTYTGKEFGIVGIDIDHLEKAREADLFKYLNKGGIVCWHGDFDPKEVRQGMRRGTLLFLYTGDELKTTGASYFLCYGFEILYGKKVAQLAGPHPNGDVYRYRGSLTPIPKALLNYLAWTIPEEEAPAPEAPVDEDAACIDEQLQQFAQLANTDLEYTRTGGVLKLAQNKWGRQLMGLCVGHRKHTNHQGDQNMRVYVEDGELKTHCFHQSCWGVRKRWEAQLKEEVCVPQKVIVKPEKPRYPG